MQNGLGLSPSEYSGSLDIEIADTKEGEAWFGLGELHITYGELLRLCFDDGMKDELIARNIILQKKSWEQLFEKIEVKAPERWMLDCDL